MGVEPLLHGLLNFGGIGLLAGVLFWLHLREIKDNSDQRDKDRQMFREELKAERAQCREEAEAIQGKLTELTRLMATLIEKVIEKQPRR